MTRMFVDPASFKRFVDAYSADRIAENGKQPVKVALFKGVLYTTTGTELRPRESFPRRVEARRLYPLNKWPFSRKPKTYQERSDSRVRGEPFYDGMLVRYGRADYVLGPERINVHQRGRA